MLSDLAREHDNRVDLRGDLLHGRVDGLRIVVPTVAAVREAVAAWAASLPVAAVVTRLRRLRLDSSREPPVRVGAGPRRPWGSLHVTFERS